LQEASVAEASLTIMSVASFTGSGWVMVKDARSARLAHKLEFKGAEHKAAAFAPDYPRAFGTSLAGADTNARDGTRLGAGNGDEAEAAGAAGAGAAHSIAGSEGGPGRVARASACC
jgi:hypothetical protein